MQAGQQDKQRLLAALQLAGRRSQGDPTKALALTLESMNEDEGGVCGCPGALRL